MHEDTRFDVGAARPLANLRHVMCECAGTPDRQERVNGLVLALDGLVRAVPTVQGNAAGQHVCGHVRGCGACWIRHGRRPLMVRRRVR